MAWTAAVEKPTAAAIKTEAKSLSIFLSLNYQYFLLAQYVAKLH